MMVSIKSSFEPLSKQIRDVVLASIEGVDLYFLNHFANENCVLLQTLYGLGVIDDESIDKALEKPVIDVAKVSYKLVASGKEYIDHVYRPEILAYALSRNDVFSDKQKRELPIDDENSLEDFIRKHLGKDLFATLRFELLNPRPLTMFDEDSP